jgi:hypothetical protein
MNQVQPGLHCKVQSQNNTRQVSSEAARLPATQEAEAGRSIESRSSRPAWATSQELVSKKTKQKLYLENV